MFQYVLPLVAIFPTASGATQVNLMVAKPDVAYLSATPNYRLQAATVLAIAERSDSDPNRRVPLLSLRGCRSLILAWLLPAELGSPTSQICCVTHLPVKTDKVVKVISTRCIFDISAVYGQGVPQLLVPRTPVDAQFVDICLSQNLNVVDHIVKCCNITKNK